MSISVNVIYLIKSVEYNSDLISWLTMIPERNDLSLVPNIH